MELKREVKTKAFDLDKLEMIMNKKEYGNADNYLGMYFFKSGINVYFRDLDNDEFIHYTLQEAQKMIPKSLMIYCVVKRAIDYSAYKFIESKQFYKQLFTPTMRIITFS